MSRPRRSSSGSPPGPRGAAEGPVRRPGRAAGGLRRYRTRDLAVWDLLRSLVETAPARQTAALFRAAAVIPGITHVPQVSDAAGRRGEAVALAGPRLGRVQFIFDTTTHVFLGERILGPGSTTSVQFNDTAHSAVVDEPGQVPPG